MSAEKYEELSQLFMQKECKLLTIFEEYKEQKGQRKVRFIAKCGHENTVFTTNFKSKNSGVICKSCSYAANKQALQEKSSIDKYQYARQGYDGMIELLQLLSNKMEYRITGEGCLADAAVKPYEVNEDKWLRVQFKTTLQPIHKLYSFSLQNKYLDCVIILYCINDKQLWVLNGNNTYPKQIRIGLKTSIYNKYKVNLMI